MPEQAARVIIVHTLEHVLAAFEAAAEAQRPLTLQSAAGAVDYAGSLYLLALFQQGRQRFPDVDATCILDCGAAGAEAVSAMQMGHRHVRSSAPDAMFQKLSSIAASLGAHLIRGNHYDALDLLHQRDVKSLCKKWLVALE